MPNYYSHYTASRRFSGNYSDPSQPDYRPEWWRRSVEHWQKTLDWTGFLDDEDFKNFYLAEIAGEFAEDRATRINAEDPEPFFKDAVSDHASMFTQLELAEDAPATLADNQDNVDLQGSDLWQWATNVFTAYFRDGGALLGADIDRNVTTGARRPRLLWVPLRDVFWPEYRDNNGVAELSRVAIRRTFNATKNDGTLQMRNQFWVYELTDQGCTLTPWEENENKKLIEGEAIALGDASGQPLTRLPFTDKLSVIGDLNMDDERLIMSPFSSILSLNRKHYNQSSELSTIRRKVACPTVNRFWANGVPPAEEIPPFYPGSGKTNDYDAGSRVEYLELSGQSMPELRQGLYDTEAKLDKRDNKLFKAAANVSATEAEIENQKAKVGMPRIKMLIESAFQDLFTVWELLANPSPQPVGSIIIDQSALDAPPNPADIIPYMQAVDRGLDMSVAAAAMIRQGLFTKEDFDEAAAMPVSPNQQLPEDPDEVII